MQQRLSVAHFVEDIFGIQYCPWFVTLRNEPCHGRIDTADRLSSSNRPGACLILCCQTNLEFSFPELVPLRNKSIFSSLHGGLVEHGNVDAET